MTALQTTVAVLYYCFLPITTTFNFILILLAPLLHIGYYILHGCLFPLRFLGKFETLYIFFGVAALIGLTTGTVLHFSSGLLVTLFNLKASSDDGEQLKTGRTTASVRAAREKKNLDETVAWQNSMSLRSQEARERAESALSAKTDYTEYMDRDWTTDNRKGGRLGSQPILEEEDDSDDAF